MRGEASTYDHRIVRYPSYTFASYLLLTKPAGAVRGLPLPPLCGARKDHRLTLQALLLASPRFYPAFTKFPNSGFMPGLPIGRKNYHAWLLFGLQPPCFSGSNMPCPKSCIPQDPARPDSQARGRPPARGATSCRLLPKIFAISLAQELLIRYHGRCCKKDRHLGCSYRGYRAGPLRDEGAG